ncbi:MAG: flagellin [Bryobacteraceae bacterium]
MSTTIDPSGEQFLADLSRVQATFARAQRQVTSGLKVSEASDAPDRIGALLQLQANLGRNTQIQSNLGLVKTDVDTAEQTVGQVIQLADQAAGFAAQGANSTQTADSRLVLAQQVQGIQEQLVSLTQANVQGRFIFGGDADQVAPYQLDLTSPNGVIRANRTSATRQIEDPAGGTFIVAKTAQDLFDRRNPDDTFAPDNLFVGLNDLRVALTANNPAGIQTAITELRQATSYVNTQQAFYGGVQNRIAAATAFAARNDTSLRTQLSAGRDADIAAAAIDLTSSQTQLQAAFDARAKTPKTSLFDFLA